MRVRIGFAGSVVSFVAKQAGKEPLEADFALFWEESIFGERKDGIVFGECKTYGKFDERDFKRMRHLAETFPGAVLVFSTLRKSLTPLEVRKISRTAKRGRRYWKAERPINPVLILTGTELLSIHGAPHCWDDATKQRFEHRYGLLNLCDITQQLYLKLPSWHTDWHQKWERRRMRYEAKIKAKFSASSRRCRSSADGCWDRGRLPAARRARIDPLSPSQRIGESVHVTL